MEPLDSCFNLIIKKKEERDKKLEFARELGKLENMRENMIPVVIGAFRTKAKGIEKGWEVKK